jgi:hypothetical protein
MCTQQTHSDLTDRHAPPPPDGPDRPTPVVSPTAFARSPPSQLAPQREMIGDPEAKGPGGQAVATTERSVPVEAASVGEPGIENEILRRAVAFVEELRRIAPASHGVVLVDNSHRIRRSDSTRPAGDSSWRSHQ